MNARSIAQRLLAKAEDLERRGDLETGILRQAAAALMATSASAQLSTCRGCGRPIERRPGPGRPRSWCEYCRAPARKSPEMLS